MTDPLQEKIARQAAPRSIMGRVQVSYPRIRQILVPLDFSGKSRQALRYAIPLARKFAARIVLLHVLTPGSPAPGPGPTDATPAGLRRAALKRLEKMAAQLLPDNLHAECVVLAGKPAAQILAALVKYDIDMVVLTTKGRTGLKRILLGSTAEFIMRHSPCPVLSVRRE